MREMRTVADHPTVTRREALFTALRGTVAAAVATPVAAMPCALPAATPLPPPSAPDEPEFVPENDYPYFGHPPDSHA